MVRNLPFLDLFNFTKFPSNKIVRNVNALANTKVNDSTYYLPVNKIDDIKSLLK